jgi:hypothetical protein
MRLRPSRKDDDAMSSNAMSLTTTDRVVRESEEQGKATEQQLNTAADQLELAISEGNHDPTVVQRVADLVRYMRSSESPSGNPMIELLRNPPRPEPPNNGSKKP